MSKNNKEYIYRLQQQRSRQKRENIKHIPSRIELQVFRYFYCFIIMLLYNLQNIFL
jgi:hypothetical protein